MNSNVSRGRRVRSERTSYREEYVRGNTVRQLQPEIREYKKPAKISNTTRKNREKAKRMSPGYVLFLSAALAMTGMILISYISLQSQITNSVKHISRLENQLNELKLTNDEDYSRITSDIDLEKVKKIAIGELGMIYAQEGQVESFASEDSDYVRQLAEIPSGY